MTDFGPEWGNTKLANFVEIREPAMVDWTPAGYGWAILLLILLTYLGLRSLRYYRRYQRNRYRREALRWLDGLPTYQADSPSPLFAQLPTLLRKVALSRDASQQVATLQHSAWEQWLDNLCPDCGFSTCCTGWLFQLAYRQQTLSPAQMNTLLQHVRHWVYHHRSADD